MSLEWLYWVGSIYLFLLLTGIGIPPIPEEAGILYAAGLTALHPEVRWWMAWPATSLGIISADLVLYAIGRWLGARVFQFHWVNRVLAPERRQRLEEQFHDHGLKFLLLARLLPPLRTGVFLIAGSVHFQIAQFLLADVMYGIVGVGLVFFGGTAFLELARHLGGWFLLAIALIIGGYVLYRYYRYLKKLELAATVEVLKAAAPESLSPPLEQRPQETEREGRHHKPPAIHR